MTEYDKSRWPEEETEVAIEKVEKFNEEDTAFFTELRVLSGPQKGALKRLLWGRYKRDSDIPQKPTESLFDALGLNVREDSSRKLVNMTIEIKPWYPDETRKFPVITNIKKTGEIDPWE